MKLSFFADENIGTELIDWLRRENYNVTSIKEAGLSGISDETIIEKCYNEKLIIITQDNDFGKIIYKQNASFHIVIYLRPGHLKSSIHIAAIQKILSHKNYIEPCTIIISQIKSQKIQIRFRKIRKDDNT